MSEAQHKALGHWGAGEPHMATSPPEVEKGTDRRELSVMSQFSRGFYVEDTDFMIGRKACRGERAKPERQG